MKKIFTFLIAVLISGAVSAQSMSPEAKEYRTSVQSFLKAEGFSPYIDEEDDALCFKKEGILYWIYFDKADPVFVEFHRETLGTDDTDQFALYKAINETNRTQRSIKAFLTKNNKVGFTIEFYSSSPKQFKDIFYENIEVFEASKNYIIEKYSEYENK